jgi:phenol/toluene 2-monooxygenase (NADH) P0/A0
MAQRTEPGAIQHPLDPHKRYVRLTQVRPDGFVEFEFAIGDPDLSVELILPADAYREFCLHNDVVQVTPIEAAEIDRGRARWSSMPDEPG